MIRKKVLPSKLDIERALRYDPVSGDLIWKQRGLDQFAHSGACVTWNARWPGKVAGQKYTHKSGSPKYVVVSLNGWPYLAHHLILKMHDIDIPEGMIVDHENRNPLDNRLQNLRVCTPQQNSGNKTKPRRNKSGYIGVFWAEGRGWLARVNCKERPTTRDVGVFGCPTAAAIAFDKWVIANRGVFANPNILTKPHLSNR